MLERTTRVNFLYDFYHSLLTEKQKMYMQAYYLEDYSLGEIAEEHEVSRQAVYDNVKRTESMLEQYESKLQLFAKFQKKVEIVRALERELSTVENENVHELIRLLKEHD